MDCTDTALDVSPAVAASPSCVKSMAPPLLFGASGEHQGFAGTISLGSDALHTAIVELARSLGPEFDGLALLSWHGGNADAIESAVAVLRAESHRVVAIKPRATDGDAHAGRTETSIMLALAPGAVRLEDAVAGDTRPLSELMPLMRDRGLKAVTQTGVLGDPAGASAAEGERLLAGLTDSALAQLERWSTVPT